MKKIFYISLIILALTGCQKIKFYDGEVKLTFSADTVFFDTVFTNIGSATRILKVYNPVNQFVKIDYISLAGGQNSAYRLNINGEPTSYAREVIIPPNDSIYIFAEVTIAPNKGYLVEQDSIIFSVNGQTQSIPLYAIGWDVHLIKTKIISSDTVWNPDKPYLIWYYVAIDTGAQLQINPGVQVFLHRNAGVFVFGSLKAYGSLDSNITFTSDRLEQDYSDVPGQWGGIVLQRTSQGNEFHWTRIKNSIVGISADSVQDTVIIHNCEIIHQSYASVFASMSNINIFGSVLADAGWYNLGIIKGGNYKIINTTIANYYGWGTIRKTPAVAVTNYEIAGNTPVFRSPVNLEIINSIIYGNQENELLLSPAVEWENFNYLIKNSLIKTTKDYTFNQCIINLDPQFSDITKFDFHLGEQSPAINKADYGIISLYSRFLDMDIDGNQRNNPADIGAYEYVEN